MFAGPLPGGLAETQQPGRGSGSLALRFARGQTARHSDSYVASRHRGELTAVHRCAYNATVEYEWDEEKATANLRKHRVDFADAALVLEDELASTVRDLYSEREERFVTLGRDPNGRLLVVVYTWRGERARLISAREATSKERRDYEKNP